MITFRDVNGTRNDVLNKGIFERCHRFDYRRIINFVLHVFHMSKCIFRTETVRKLWSVVRTVRDVTLM